MLGPGLRYRKAAEVIKKQGKMSCLIINDIDAGVGRFKQTQATAGGSFRATTRPTLNLLLLLRAFVEQLPSR